MMVNINIKQDFSREVVCLFGIPFDIVDMKSAVSFVNQSIENNTRCIISTPNLNFVINSRKSPDFLKSVLNSDMILLDGMPLLWVSRLLGLNIPERVAGSSLLDYLYKNQTDIKTRVFFFGGEAGIAEQATLVTNKTEKGLEVKGFYDPGFTSVEKMSSEAVIEKINSSGADFLILALGAAKGQHWIEYNKSKLSVPVISHLGAAINFIAGSVQRAPGLMQKSGLEWLWRIYQEPKLWKRYFFDGIGFIHLLATRIFPYLVWLKTRSGNINDHFEVEMNKYQEETSLTLNGSVTKAHIEQLARALYKCFLLNKNISVDVKKVTFIDSYAIAKLLILEKHLHSHNNSLRIINADKQIRKIFFWNCAESLINQKDY